MEEESYECPYCGEVVTALLDLSGGDQQYIEDCPGSVSYTHLTLPTRDIV